MLLTLPMPPHAAAFDAAASLRHFLLMPPDTYVADADIIISDITLCYA